MNEKEQGLNTLHSKLSTVMVNPLLVVFKLLPSRPIYAHCDIPCGIYDPHVAQMAAHSVLRMNQLIEKVSPDDPKEAASTIARLIEVKERHAELVKQEIRVLWGDYFKPEHIEKYPDLHDQVFQIMKLASKARQEISTDSAQKLLEAVQKIAEVFYQTKGLEVVRIPSGYPTEGEIVTHK